MQKAASVQPRTSPPKSLPRFELLKIKLSRFLNSQPSIALACASSSAGLSSQLCSQAQRYQETLDECVRHFNPSVQVILDKRIVGGSVLVCTNEKKHPIGIGCTVHNLTRCVCSCIPHSEIRSLLVMKGAERVVFSVRRYRSAAFGISIAKQQL